uniref:Uncharacterized protein n=1 Tax=Timema shepardi TaxID=629360 RepID=A0A7R9FXP2_TIMSH|nr:unnamed protein product [Timema shepardi]
MEWSSCWLLSPLLVVCVPSITLLSLLLLQAIFCSLYKLLREWFLPNLAGVLFLHQTFCFLVERLRRERQVSRTEETRLWKAVSMAWKVYGLVWHAYECHGLHNIPAFGPALIVYYKCDIPVDLLCLQAEVLLTRGIVIFSATESCVFRLTGLSLLSKALRLVPATLEDCSVVLHEHQVLAVAAEGGQQYNLLYTPHEELYRMVLQAKVPVIPMFTQNVCESHLTTRGWRLPVALLVGNFPVKLSTHLGKPISYSPNSTPRELHAQATLPTLCISDRVCSMMQVMDAIEELIERNQKLPGSIPRALLERVRGTRRMEGEYPQFVL